MLLQKGSKGTEVVRIQKMLNQVLSAKLKVDGIFGEATEQAVKNFQRQKGLKVDGIVGHQTSGVLEQEYKLTLSKLQKSLPQNTIISPMIKSAPKKVDADSFIKKSDVKYIVLHHSASSKPLTWEQIDAEHKRKGWAGFGYHFLIDPDGTITAGRALNKETIIESNQIAEGAQAKGLNSQSIGICFNGNFEVDRPTSAQIEAGKQLVKWLKYKIFNKPQVLGHKDVVNIVPNATVTACPGKNFPLDDFKKI